MGSPHPPDSGQTEIASVLFISRDRGQGSSGFCLHKGPLSACRPPASPVSWDVRENKEALGTFPKDIDWIENSLEEPMLESVRTFPERIQIT